MSITAILGLPLRLIRRNRGQHAGDPYSEPFERVADTDIRRIHGLPPAERLPLTPLPAPAGRGYALHVIPDVPAPCHCGRGARHLLDACETGTAEDIDAAFSTAQFEAVTP
jgi:hypothetical protein